MEDINNIPIVNQMIQDSRENRDSYSEDIQKLPHLLEYYKSLNSPDVQQEFESLLFPLEKMGYKRKLIFRSYIVFRYKDIAEAVDILSKNNNLWTHKFIVGFKGKCYVCEDQEKNHLEFNKPKENVKITKKDSLRNVNLESKKLNEALLRVRSSKNNLDFDPKGFTLSNNKVNPYTGNIQDLNQSENCPICILKMELNNIMILNCQHKFCKDCIVSYLEEEIKNSRVDPIKCPQNKCLKSEQDISYTFTDDVIKSLVSPEYYEKYLDFKLKLYIEKDKNLTFCPIPNCKGYARLEGIKANKTKDSVMNYNKVENTDSNYNINNSRNYYNYYNFENHNEKDLLLNKNENGNIILNVSNDNNNKYNNNTSNYNTIDLEKVKLVCINNHEFCYKCKSKWEYNHDCEKDVDFIKYFNENENIKKCPRCKNYIEKNRGCNHMTCIICKYEFCWLCMRECLPDHFNIRGTSCYGKQFPPEELDPQMQQALEDLNNSSLFFFVFSLTFFIIRLFHHTYFNLNNNNIQQNQNRNNANNNNNNIEINNVNENAVNVNNVGQLQAQAVVNANNVEQPQANNRSKCGFFAVMGAILIVLWFIMLFINGVFLGYMIKSLTVLSPQNMLNLSAAERAKASHRFLFFSFLFLWLVFYLPGLILTTLWLIVSFSYLIYLLIAY